MTKAEAHEKQHRLAAQAPPGTNYRVFRDRLPWWWSARKCRKRYESEGWHVEPYDLDALVRQATGS